MGLRCEPRDALTASERDEVAVSAPWVRVAAFESLLELNVQCLELFAEQANARGAPPNLLLRQIGELCRSLDESGRRRAAACPYLLINVGFADAERWRRARERRVADGEPAAYDGLFTVPQASRVATRVFTYAWHLVRSQAVAARLILGMSAHSAVAFGELSLHHVHELAELHADWLRPRWGTRVKLWRDLLLAAASGEDRALLNARLHGFQMLAAEARTAVT